MKQIRDELRRTEDKIQEIAGVSTKPYFRPPYGDYDSRVDRIAFEEGYEYNVLWYVDGLGWEGRSTKIHDQRHAGERLQRGDLPLPHR